MTLEDLRFAFRKLPIDSSRQLPFIHHLSSKFYYVDRRHSISYTIRRFFRQYMFCNWLACNTSLASHRETETQTSSKTNGKLLVCQTHLVTNVPMTSDFYSKTTYWVYTSTADSLIRCWKPLLLYHWVPDPVVLGRPQPCFLACAQVLPLFSEI